MRSHYIVALVGLFGTLSVTAQELHHEIDVEREITPVEREASRLVMLPEISLPALPAVSLPFSSLMVTAEVTPAFSPLSPVASDAGLKFSDCRGYLHAGAFPLFNAEIAAGYRIMHTDRTLLRAWGTYDGRVYRRDIPATTDRRYWRDHSASAGVALNQALGEKSLLTAGLTYAYSRFNMHGPAESYNQWLNRVDARAAFSSSAGRLSYKAALNLERFAYGLHDADAASQTVTSFAGAAAIALGSEQRVGIDVDADVIHSALNSSLSTTSGLITLEPYYAAAIENRVISLRAGARIGIAVNDGKSLHISPAVKAAWNPSPYFGLEIDASGGMVTNSLASLYDDVRYCNPLIYYGSSTVPYDITAKIKVGPFRGAYLEIERGYARADGYLMPMADYAAGGGVTFAATDLRAWRWGATAGWNSRLIGIKANYTGSPQTFTHAYYLNRDRAAHVMTVSLSLRPVSRLEIEASYGLRACRAIYGFEPVDIIQGVDYSSPVRHSLGNATDLRLGARYDVNSTLSLFARGENLLNRNFIFLGDRPSQGITALIGVNLKIR